MTRDEALAEAERLTREHPDRETHRWIAREGAEGDWEVAKIKLPEGLRRKPLKETIETKPKPPEPDDPRSAHDRNVGPYGPA